MYGWNSDRLDKDQDQGRYFYPLDAERHKCTVLQRDIFTNAQRSFRLGLTQLNQLCPSKVVH